MRRPGCSSEERGSRSGARPQPQEQPAALPPSPGRHEQRPEGREGTHEGQLAPLHRPELGEVVLQLLCGKTHPVTRARSLRAAAAAPARPPAGPSPHTAQPRRASSVRDGSGGADSLLDTVQGISATKMSKSRRERRPAARTALAARTTPAAAMSGLR